MSGIRMGIVVFFWILRTDIDVPTCLAAFFFDFGEIRAFIPVGFGVVVVGDCVKAGGCGGATGDDGIGHADDRGRIPAAAEFAKDRPVGAKASLDGCAETVRKCSSYSASARYRILLPASKSQYLLTMCFPGRSRTNEDGGTE